MAAPLRWCVSCAASLFAVACQVGTRPFTVQVPGRPDLLLTELTVPVRGGLSEEIPLQVSREISSTLVDLEGNEGEYRPATVVLPSGIDIIESGNWVTRDAREVSGQVDWLLPNSPEVRLENGIYRARFTALAPGGRTADELVTVRLYSRLAGAVNERCRVRLDLMVPVEARQVLDVERTAEALVAALGRLLGQAGISVADYAISTVPLDAPDLVITGRNVAASARAAVRRALERGREGALHLLFARSLRTSDGVELRGYSMGLPGPYDANRATSAVLIAVEPFSQAGAIDIGELAVTSAHEIGHYMGLYHTSESNGLLVDPLPDTPECRPGGADCDDATNVMYYTGAGRERLTAHQGAVMRSHPLCEPFP
jgi:hypothetical protein